MHAQAACDAVRVSAESARRVRGKVSTSERARFWSEVRDGKCLVGTPRSGYEASSAEGVGPVKQMGSHGLDLREMSTCQLT